tara:strand:- start:3794 stop:4015 length:222 start_codon:yes stop_codon:yes gene_type:complete
VKQLDLHNVSHENASIVIDDFIILNFLNLPIEIITGNSVDMQMILKKIADKHHLRIIPSHDKNLGSYIINKHL